MEARLMAFLERLLGEPVDPAGRVLVSSTQRAQIVSWLRGQGIEADFNRFKANLMSVQDMLAGGTRTTENAPASRQASRVPPMRPVAPFASASPPLGIGIDIQSIAALPQAINYRAESFYAGNFTERELAHCLAQGDPRQSFAGVWAAKEAVVKAGAAVASKPGKLDDIEIEYSPAGAPLFPGCLLSISHEQGLAVAVCLRLA